MLKLKNISLFKGISLDFINMIIDNSRRLEVKKGDFIINEGDKGNDEAYIIQEGKAGVYIKGSFIKNLGEGEIFGEMALITNENRIASIKAESDLILLRINKKLLLSVIKNFKNGKEIQETIMSRISENLKNNLF